MTQPLVSIVTSCYNHVAFVEASVVSAIEQDYENIELIVADDASTDGTAEKLTELAQRWPGKLFPILNDTNVGITRNMNRAMARRRGKYVCLLSTDDLYLPGKIRRQVEWLEGGADRAACGHAVEAFDDATGEVRWVQGASKAFRSKQRLVDALTFGFFHGLSMMMRSDVIPAYGFDERVLTVCDLKLELDCILGNGRWGYIPDILARYRLHDSSITQRAKRDASIQQTLLDDYMMTLALAEALHPEMAAACASARALLLFATGRSQAQRREYQSARAYYAAALHYDAFRAWKAVPAWILTRFPERLREACEIILERRRAFTIASRNARPK